ncbi:MAG: DUF58 domain-containing protein [Planctomycetota bacterium]|nr:DUF58 domain-containing protein [Planctomycetota bacterium]
MKFRPGKNLIGAVALLTLFSPSCFYWPVLMWGGGGLLLLLMFGVGLGYRRLERQKRALKVGRKIPKSMGRGVSFSMQLEIGNTGASPVKGWIRDDLPPVALPRYKRHGFELDAGEEQCLASSVCIPERGSYLFSRVWVELVDWTGLLGVQFELAMEDRLRVLPEVFSSEKGLQQSRSAAVELLDKLKMARQQGLGTEFDSLSEFREGDDYRRIDWRSTQRIQYPVVRRFQIERHRDVVILIDCGRLMGQMCGNGSKLDCAVDGGLMIARVALNGGDRCGIGLFDSRVIGYVPPQSGDPALKLLTECVYDARSEYRESNFASMFSTLQARQQKRSLVIVISDILDRETSTRFRNSLASLARQHLVLFAALKTPVLKNLLEKKSEALQDGFEKAVTFRLLRDRSEAIQSIQQAGVQILDVEPSELTTPLINRFIELRQGTHL